MSNTPLVKDNISISFDSQDTREDIPQKPKRGPGRPRLPGGPKDIRGWRHRFRTDLLGKQDGCCADCRQKREIQLYRFHKGDHSPKASNYVLLCSDCVRKRKGQPKSKAGQRRRIRKALQAKQGRKYGHHYRCFGCLKRKKLRLYRVHKGHDPLRESDYIFLCSDCIRKRVEEQKKTRLWTRKPGKKKGISKTAMFASIRPLVFKRDGHECVWCGVKKKLGLGPLIPPSRGGKICFDNYVVTCQSCRGAKQDKLPLEHIWGKITLDYWLHEQLDDSVTVKNPGVTQRLNLHLIGEISQFLMRIATNENIEGRIRNVAEKLNIKLSETDEDRGKERKAEVGSWIA